MTHLRTISTTGAGTATFTKKAFLYGASIACGAAASSIIIRDGGASGEIVFVMAVPAAAASQHIYFPHPLPVTNIHITNSASTQESVVYFTSDT